MFKMTLNRIIVGIVSAALVWQVSSGQTPTEVYIYTQVPRIMAEIDARYLMPPSRAPRIGHNPGIGNLGWYDEKNDTVHFSSHASTIGSDNLFDRTIGRIFYYENRRDMDYTMHHELGHRFIENLSKQIQGRPLIDVDDYRRVINSSGDKELLEEFFKSLAAKPAGMSMDTFEDDFIEKLAKRAGMEINDYRKQMEEKARQKSNYYLLNIIDEGLAEYVRCDGKEADVFSDDMWSPNLLPRIGHDDRGTWDVALYKGGYHLVLPILRQHGRKGIEYIIRNPPKIPNDGKLPDKTLLPRYQQRILRELAAAQ